MEIAAREVRHKKMKELGLRREEIGVIYLTPCPAKMVAIKYPPRKRASHIDGAIGISDIYHSSPFGHRRDRTTARGRTDEPVTGIGLGWPVAGRAGLLAAGAKQPGGGRAGRCGEDSGRNRAAESWVTSNIVECHACPQGCCGGSLTVGDPYVTRSTILSLVARFGSQPCQDREKIRELYQRNYFSLPGKIPSRPFAPLDKDIARAIEKRKRIQEMYETLPQINCGACGAPTCQSFAEDVVLERAALEECVVW